MPSSSDVFVVSACSAIDPGEALHQAIKQAGVNPARVQDFIFGIDGPMLIGIDELAREVLINCPQVTVSSSLRALFFAAQSILCEDANLILVGGSDGRESAALLLVSPAAVGVYNLTPLARLDAHSLTSLEHALKKAEHTIEEIEVRLEGTCGVVLAVQLVEQLQDCQAVWGLVQVGSSAMLIERI